MVNNAFMIGIAVGVFIAGIGVGYAIYGNTYNPSAMMQDPQFMQRWTETMSQNPKMMNSWMNNMMQNTETRNQWMTQSPQMMGPMMSYWMQDPELQQQMFDNMLKNREFMQQWMNNQQFQQEWMYPNMMQDWKMGPMAGGSMMSERAATSSVKTNQVTIPLNAWNPNSTEHFKPLNIEVESGAAVTWTNKDDTVHSVVDSNNRFDSNLLWPNEDWSYTFDIKGSYYYYCTLHPWMKGTVKVN